jgi:hypothetical protein
MSLFSPQSIILPLFTSPLIKPRGGVHLQKRYYSSYSSKIGTLQKGKQDGIEIIEINHATAAITSILAA